MKACPDRRYQTQRYREWWQSVRGVPEEEWDRMMVDTMFGRQIVDPDRTPMPGNTMSLAR